MKENFPYKYKGLLIDLDDTLCNTDETFRKYGTRAAYRVLKEPLGLKDFQSFEELLEEAKAEIKTELAGTASSHNRILYFKRIADKQGGELKPDVLRKAYRNYWKETIQNLKLFPGVIETLEELKQMNLKLAIVSDMTTEIQLEKIHYLNIAKYFDAVVTSEEVGAEKPHPSIFHSALFRLKLLASEVIMIGDNAMKDIEGAESLHMETVQIITREDRRVYKEGYFKPDHIIHNFAEIIDIIKSSK